MLTKEDSSVKTNKKMICAVIYVSFSINYSVSMNYLYLKNSNCGQRSNFENKNQINQYKLIICNKYT